MCATWGVILKWQHMIYKLPDTQTKKEKKIKTIGLSHEEEWEVHSDNSASTLYPIIIQNDNL